MKAVVINANVLGQIFKLLQQDAYQIVGPREEAGAIVYSDLDSPADLPEGWIDEQGKGHYRLKRSSDKARFAYVVGPQSWKKYLYPPEQLLMRARRQEQGFVLEDITQPVPKYAFIGVRACELRAIAIQDQVFLHGPYVDTHYQDRREKVFIVAVNCLRSGSNCFCVSMDAGPEVQSAYDLVLSEILPEGEPRYVLKAGSVRGEQLLQRLPAAELQTPSSEDLALEQAGLRSAAETMQRSLPQETPELIQAHYNSDVWQAMQERCLACTNCTMVCPTCFCSNVTDTTDLSGQQAERSRHWDSCFSLQFTYTAGQPARQSIGSRYRQWISHKLSSWHTQFDSSGCVGCGRCISWCPVGIDITEEVAHLAGLSQEGAQHAG